MSTNFKYTAFALRVLQKLMGTKFSVSGIKNLPNQPTIFVANHFTRSETFFVPYLIYKHTGRQIRCLADSSVFVGALGRFLRSTGAVSTRDPERDNIILKDLITGEHDWMIYPEGSMIKSKETRRENLFVNYTPSRVGPVRTGAAVLSLKSQLRRDNIIEASKKRGDILKNLEFELGVKYRDNFKDMNTHIVPLTITYYPIRPGHNSIKGLVERLIKKIPSRIVEELEIEGNILLGAEINVHFGKSINLGEHVKAKRAVIKKIPMISRVAKNNFILRYFRSSLTNKFMDAIYSNIQINLDHIFSAALHHFKENEIEINRLKRVVYLSANLIVRSDRYRTNDCLLEKNIYKIFLDEPHVEFDSVFELAKKQGLITEIFGNKITINKSLFERKVDFHEIRIENTLRVIANEFFLLDSANSIVKRAVKTADDELRQKAFAEIYKHDLENFDSDYALYHDKKLSKDKTVGSPSFLNSKSSASEEVKKIGIMVLHGYKSAPKEVEPLAKFLNGFGFKVYSPRMHGHGTAPLNMKDTSFEEWYDSVQRAYAALNNISAKIILVGFSTGGLLALLSCIRKSERSKKISAVVSINAALKLVDIRSRLIPGIKLWNEILDKFNMNRAKLEYVDDEPENPHINYNRNYVNGVYELGKLMEVCEDNLDKITTSALVIQADKDPVVNPVSGKIIYKKIRSKEKFLVEMDFSNHVIVSSEGKERVFEEIRKFLQKIKII
jgi:esterase/lipase/1-acyl-sn-glycerol-3-phosphate acyltransferase